MQVFFIKQVTLYTYYVLFNDLFIQVSKYIITRYFTNMWPLQTGTIYK